MPEQLPVGVSWRETVPEAMDWITGPDVDAAILDARACRRDSRPWCIVSAMALLVLCSNHTRRKS